MNFSAAVFTLTFGPVAIAILAVVAFHLFSFDSKLVLVASEDEDEEKPEEKSKEPVLVVNRPYKRMVKQGIEFERLSSGHVSSRADRLYEKEVKALLEVITAEGPYEYERHFRFIAKAHKYGSGKERSLHRAILRKSGGEKTFVKVCVLQSNLTGMKYAAFYKEGKKFIYSQIDWE